MAGEISPVLMPEFAWCHTTRVDARHYWHLHQHANHEIIFTDSGTYYCLVNGVALEVPANHLLVIKPGDWHEDRCPTPVHFFSIRFELSSPYRDAGLSLFREQITPAEQVIAVDRELFLSLVARIDAEMKVEDEVTGMIRDAMVRELFWRMVRAFPRARISPFFLQNSADQSWIARVYQVFAANRHRPFSVSEMAGAMGMPARTFTYRCQALLADSPAHAFLHYRMELADRMLAQTDMTMSAISEALGFANPYHFSRTFKAHHGVCPSARRRTGRQSLPK